MISVIGFILAVVKMAGWEEMRMIPWWLIVATILYPAIVAVVNYVINNIQGD